MEFVIVLPIYFVLFGYVFLLGDLGLKTIQLAVGDRDAAMDAGNQANDAYLTFSESQLERSGSRTAQSATFRADEGFRGAWSWQAAGLVKLWYKLPNWMSGYLAYPYLRYGSPSPEGAVVSLVKGRSIELRSKDYDNERDFNYYTVKRTELSRQETSYRNWAPSQLVEGGLSPHWHTSVFGEEYANANGGSLDEGWAYQSRDANPTQPGGESIYKRYGQFMRWSQ